VHLRMDRIDSMKPSSDTFEIQTPKLVSTLNLKDKIGRTPLHLAVYFGNPKIVEILMFLKADDSIKDEFGFWAIDYLGMNQFVVEETVEEIRSHLSK